METQQPETLQPSNEELNYVAFINILRVKIIHECGVALGVITSRLAKGSTVDHPLLDQVGKTIEMCKDFNHISVSYCPAEQSEPDTSEEVTVVDEAADK